MATMPSLGSVCLGLLRPGLFFCFSRTFFVIRHGFGAALSPHGLYHPHRLRLNVPTFVWVLCADKLSSDPVCVCLLLFLLAVRVAVQVLKPRPVRPSLGPWHGMAYGNIKS